MNPLSCFTTTRPAAPGARRNLRKKRYSSAYCVARENGSEAIADATQDVTVACEVTVTNSRILNRTEDRLFEYLMNGNDPG